MILHAYSSFHYDHCKHNGLYNIIMFISLQENVYQQGLLSSYHYTCSRYNQYIFLRDDEFFFAAAEVAKSFAYGMSAVNPSIPFNYLQCRRGIKASMVGIPSQT